MRAATPGGAIAPPAPVSATPRRHVAIAWHGLPFYATRLLGALVRREPDTRFTLLTTVADDFQKYPRFDDIQGVPVRVLDRHRRYTWSGLDLPPPALFVFTSWSHPGYLHLAADGRRRAGTRTVSMMDNIFTGRAKQWAGLLWYRAVLRRQIDAVWVPGARSRRFARLLGVAATAINERLYGADPAIFGAPDAPAVLRAGVLYVGQLIERKGVPALLEAARRSPEFATRLTMVGDGPLAADIDHAGVRRHGFLHGPQLAPLYARHSVFMLPSRREHWGVVLHEAALSGCLLVATNACGAVDDLIVHGRNGWIMRRGTSTEILAADAWARGLGPAAVTAGRRLSRERAAAFGPEAFCREFARLQKARVA